MSDRRRNGKRRILLVDDEVSCTETIKMALEAWGYDVASATNGEEALAAYEDYDPDLVLSDMVMPKLDGIGLLRRLKQLDPDLGVVLFTAYASLADAVLAMKEGAADVLTKPIDFKKLQHELESWLECNGSAPTEIAELKSVPPSNSGYRPPESDFQMRDQRPRGSFHNAGFKSLPGGRLSAPGPVYRGRN